ncbi:MAG: ethanolamine ammonia-lyase reactivating factor EutA [Polyangiaceae bacterium]|nr:ethanolamine ammonia-lyase reactivating factor EutA [Polyangiaceae bacterium]
MGSRVTLIGLDFGSTTSGAVVADASLARRAGAGRLEIAAVEERFRSELVLTPFAGDAIDVARVRALLDGWLASAGVRGQDLFGGGAIITGLAARRGNAAELAQAVRDRVGGAVMAVAEDPCLEAWMAFMGSAAAASRARPRTPILNLDVGGGTTNLALGLAGEVLSTGCLSVGARHVALAPGAPRIESLSGLARELLAHLGIRRGPGDLLLPEEIEAIVGYQVDLLEAAVLGRSDAFDAPLARRHVDAPLTIPAERSAPSITFSGGVGELVYMGQKGLDLPPAGHYGDLGVELARRILRSKVLSAAVEVPPGAGRATAFGLLRHSTQLSGSTLFLPRPALLPLSDLPILGRLCPTSAGEEIERVLDLVRRSARGGAVAITLGATGAAPVRDLGRRLAAALRAAPLAPGAPLVLLVDQNAAKALGGYVTGWGAAPLDLVVLDELEDRGAHFVQIGRLTEQIVPVSFHGMR